MQYNTMQYTVMQYGADANDMRNDARQDNATRYSAMPWKGMHNTTQYDTTNTRKYDAIK